MAAEYPITSYRTIFCIWRLKLIEIKKYRFKVIRDVRPRDWPEEVGSLKYKIEWK
jgi:hypothetical protein